MYNSTFKKPDFVDYKKKQEIKKQKYLEKKRLKQEKKEKKKAKKKEKRYIENLPKVLTELCHRFVKLRDCDSYEVIETNKGTKYIFTGKCCCCGKVVSGSKFQAGHYRAKSTCGLLLKYHPWNINGQCSDCNMWIRQDSIKPEYAEFMRLHYGQSKMEKMLVMKNSKSLKIQADKYFFESMIDLFKDALITKNDNEIIQFLDNYL